jgi:hypothetical protein
MKSALSKSLAAVLISALVSTASAQQPVSLSKQAEAVKQKADHLAPNDPISVIRIHAGEEYGTFLSNDRESFTFYDIDSKSNATLKYTEVRKLKEGYGGYNTIAHKHTDRRKGLIITAAVIGGLLIFAVVAAVASK